MTKAVTFLFYLSILILSTACYQDKELEIEKLPYLSESEVNLSEISLQLAKEFYPDLDTEKYEKQLDTMVTDIKLRTKGITDPDYRVRVINTYLFKELGFRYDLEDPGVRKADNRYLNGVLETKRGSCITLPLLYVVLGQKLGYPMYPVLVPKHFFVRYVDSRMAAQNIEATNGGGFSPDWMYQRDFNISEVGIKSGAYLKTLSYKEYLSELLSLNAASHSFENKDFVKGLKYTEIAINLRPNTPELYRLKGTVSYQLSKKYNIEGNLKLATYYINQADELARKSYELGFVKLSDVEYLKSVEEKKLALKQ